MYSYFLFLNGDGDAKFSTLWGLTLARARVKARARVNGRLRAKPTIFISFDWAVLNTVGNCCDGNADRILE